jgi:hypothetical protein
MSAIAFEATDGRVGAVAPGSITFTQPMNNMACTGSAITSGTFSIGGNPLLVSSSVSGSSSAGSDTMIASVGVAPGNLPAGLPTVMANPANSHFPLVRSWALVQGAAPSTGATVTVSPKQNLAQNGDDYACVTVCELGAGAPLAVRAVVGPTAVATAALPGQPLLYQPFFSFGGPLLIRAAASGWVQNAAGIVSVVIELDGQEVARTEILAAPSMHLATVPVDVLVDAGLGHHVIAMRITPGVTCVTDVNDYFSLLVLEQTGPPDAIEISPLLVNAPCMDQQGKGTAAVATFTSGGGTLVIQASGSAFAASPTRLTLNMLLDGQPLVINGTAAALRSAVNVNGIHVAMVSNDIVAPGIPAGSHTLALTATDGVTFTNADDRCSITVLELPPATG